ncbi:Demethylsterigmatocystin 6-O-methyltransferase [Cyphellophora attinorum]|uniref:Demethylsterigmatocystin 6-O-methyltransferase n=1 Tax=Cyphellophora attinorum TaxID=1664694 RepID=A0A0N0NQD5_9EURO|nr:Demethylsterigmatocystin 6-O-methyltransferase [Phialophora attinorum]KPI43781.1 Demethylsterigmatocystin 6-O-methyltransferase [Phialophora attinorum]
MKWHGGLGAKSEIADASTTERMAGSVGTIVDSEKQKKAQKEVASTAPVVEEGGAEDAKHEADLARISEEDELESMVIAQHKECPLIHTQNFSSSIGKMRQPCALQTVVEEINQLSEHGLQQLAANDELRRAAIDAARRLTLLVQTPEEAVRSLAFSPTYNACVRIAIDLHLFDRLLESPCISSARLAERVGAEDELIIRLMRVLCGIGFAEEVAAFHYSPTRITAHMCKPSTAASIIHFFDQGFPSISQLPRYFQDKGYCSPDDYTAGPFQYGHQTDLETYSFWLTKPTVINNFNVFMQGGKLKKEHAWTDWFPTQDTIVNGFKASAQAVMLVDVAGGKGRDLESFRMKHIDSPGRLVLQDLPETIEEISGLHKSIEKVAYNFFTPQPVQGARAYFMQDIFHNWPTSVAQMILQNTAQALTPGYSKLLISETVLPDRDCPLTLAGLDWGMMYLHSGLERSERQWKDLLAKEGLKVVQVHREEGGDSSIIEAMLDDSDDDETFSKAGKRRPGLTRRRKTVS